MTLSFYDQPLRAPARLRDGTHRAAALEATWRRFAPLAGHIGLTRLADVTVDAWPDDAKPFDVTLIVDATASNVRLVVREP